MEQYSLLRFAFPLNQQPISFCTGYPHREEVLQRTYYKGIVDLLNSGMIVDNITSKNQESLRATRQKSKN